MHSENALVRLPTRFEQVVGRCGDQIARPYWHKADVSFLANVRLAPIVLKNSEIAALQKWRKYRMLAISAAARLCRIDTSAGGPFCGN
jgi:hypothetical protein